MSTEINAIKICKWCNTEHTKLAKSHIIPESFFTFDRKNDRSLISQDDYKNRCPTGPYDSNILCTKCEHDFQNIDSIAADILLNKFKEYIVPFNDKRDEIAFRISRSHKQNLKRFIIYTLWKASLSEHAAFKSVQLGAHNDKIKNAIISNKIFDMHEYSFAAYHIEKPAAMLMPLRLDNKKHEGRNYYKLTLANFVFDIKVDNKSNKGLYKDIAEDENVVFSRLLETPPKIWEAMSRIVKLQQQKFGDPIKRNNKARQNKA